MTDEAPAPKRRGRPPGSKNKPKATTARRPREVKPVEAAPQTIFDDPTPSAEDIEWMDAPLGPVGAPPLIDLEPMRIKVVLQFRAPMSQQTTDYEIDWPAAWPLPSVHDAVMNSPTTGGRVQSINFRLDLRQIHILVT